MTLMRARISRARSQLVPAPSVIKILDINYLRDYLNSKCFVPSIALKRYNCLGTYFTHYISSRRGSSNGAASEILS